MLPLRDTADERYKQQHASHFHGISVHRNIGSVLSQSLVLSIKLEFLKGQNE